MTKEWYIRWYDGNERRASCFHKRKDARKLKKSLRLQGFDPYMERITYDAGFILERKEVW